MMVPKHTCPLSHCPCLGQACLLENTRFHAEDVDNDLGFSQALAALCDIFVCDAFGVMHRDQASVTVSPLKPRRLTIPALFQQNPTDLTCLQWWGYEL